MAEEKSDRATVRIGDVVAADMATGHTAACALSHAWGWSTECKCGHESLTAAGFDVVESDSPEGSHRG